MTPKRSSLLGVAAALVLVASVAFLIRGQGRVRVSTEVWFYDLNTGQLFPAPADAVPPIAAPSGPLPDGSPAGVRAHVYGCGSCAPADRYVAYLELFTPQAQAELAAAHQRSPTTTMLPPETQDGVQDGILVRLPEGGDWLEQGSAEGQELLARALANRCGAGHYPHRCDP